MTAKELIENRLLPKKLSVSKQFSVGRKAVKIETAYSPIEDLVALNVRILDQSKPVSFGMLTSHAYDPIECAVFGTKTVSCGLTPKMPQCRGCELNFMPDHHSE